MILSMIHIGMILSIGIVLIGHGTMDIGVIILTIGVVGVVTLTHTILCRTIILSLLQCHIILLCVQVVGTLSCLDEIRDERQRTLER